MIKISLNEKIRQCDHCGATNIKRTYCIHLTKSREKLYIGRICISNMTDVDTSGNPHGAVERLQLYFKDMEEEEVIDMVAAE